MVVSIDFWNSDLHILAYNLTVGVSIFNADPEMSMCNPQFKSHPRTIIFAFHHAIFYSYLLISNCIALKVNLLLIRSKPQSVSDTIFSSSQFVSDPHYSLSFHNHQRCHGHNPNIIIAILRGFFFLFLIKLPN